MQLLSFNPILKRIRWGGRRLGTVLGKAIGAGSDYAESWEIADVGADQSIVADGPLRGESIHRLLAEHEQEILGRHASLAKFPLLIKLLDASDRLSVQVHPNDHQARRMAVGDNGKTEAWIILDALPGSRIYAGLKANVGEKEFARSLADGTVEECLHSFPAAAGDCVFVPAGTVHAIGEGNLLAEIQQPSDATFRIFDWGRTDPSGKPRQLHLLESMACTDFTRGPLAPVTPRISKSGGNQLEELAACEYFVIRRHTLAEPLALPQDDRFHVLIGVEGRTTVTAGDETRDVAAGQTLLVPASATAVRLTPIGRSCVLETYLP